MTKLKYSWLFAAPVVLGGYVLVSAQTAAEKGKLTDPHTDLIEATRVYKASAEDLLRLQQEEVNKATDQLTKLRSLVGDGLVARAELQEGEQTVAALQAKVEATRQQITASDQRIAALKAEEEQTKVHLATSPGKRLSTKAGTSGVIPTILRYPSSKVWSLANLGGIQAFFYATFGHALPTSAIGQSSLHNQLGLDHRNAVDVALHPDSVEGRSLINYLQSQGIPFLAFRGAVPGMATGPHIHIGNPSHRMA